MATPINEKHLEIIASRSGVPTSKVELFNTTGSWNSKGFLATWYNVRSTPSQTLTPFGEFQTHIFGEDTSDDYSTWGVPIRTNYEQQLNFFWRQQPPDGIASSQLSNDIWAVVFEGYLIVDEEIVRNSLRTKIGFNIYCPTRCKIEFNNEIVFDDSAPTGKSSKSWPKVEAGEAIPIRIALSNMETTNNTFKATNRDMYFALEWFPFVSKFDIGLGRFLKTKEETRLADLSHFNAGASVENIVGEPTGDELDEVTGIPVNPDETIWFESPVTQTLGKWTVGEEFFVSFTENAGNSFKVFIDGEDTGKSVRPGDRALLDFGGDKTIRVKMGNIEQNSSFVVRAPDFLRPLVDINGLPLVQQIDIQRNEDQAATATFTVPLTKARYNKNRVNKDNCYSFDFERGTQGVLRKNRLVKISQGYSGNLTPTFIGYIKNIAFSDTKSDKTITVTCVDLTKNLIDGMIDETPNEVSWLRLADIDLNSFDPTVTVDNMRKPKAYDAWKLTSALEDLCYRAGVSARALHGVDENGVGFIDRTDDRLEKTYIYPFQSKINSIGNVVELDYLWKYEFGTFYWDAVQRIIREFGRPFRFNARGFAEFMLPDNPVLVKWFTDNDNPANNELEVRRGIVTDVIEAIPSPTVGNFRAVRGFIWTQQGEQDNAFTIEFFGYGLSLLLLREMDTDAEISVEIDGIEVNGKNVLDNITEDVGAPEYLLQLNDKGRFAVELRDEKGNELLDTDQPSWYYKDGVHPSLRRNPTVVPIAQNLTFGSHTCTISVHGKSSVSLDGAFVFKRKRKTPVHIFRPPNDLVSMSAEDTDTDIRNSVTVIGAQRGVTGEAYSSKAIDIRSTLDEASPAYIGYEKPMVLIQPSIRSQAKADFVALNILTRYSRSYRVPAVESIGLPHLEDGDCVAIENLKFGFTLPVQFLPSERLLVIDPDTQNRYWITSVTTSMTKQNWTASYQVTPYPPQPAHEKLPELPQQVEDQLAIGDTVQNFQITTSPTVITAYNTYLEDSDRIFTKVEFDLIRPARTLELSVYVANTFEYRESQNLDVPKRILLAGTEVNTLFWSEEIVPEGHYEFFWDGWWADASNGGSEGGGRYFPHSSTQGSWLNETTGSNVEFRANLVREDTGIGETYWSGDKEKDLIINGTTIPSSNKSTKRSVFVFGDDSVYGQQDPVTYSFPTGQVSTTNLASDFVIFDSRADQEDDTGALKIIMETTRPGIIDVSCYAFQYLFIWDDRQVVFSSPIHAMLIPVFQSSEIFPAGKYTILFTPSAQMRNNGNNLREHALRIVNPNFAGLGRDGRTVDGFVDGIPPDGIVPFGYIPPKILDKVAGDFDVYGAWFFLFPSSRQFQGIVPKATGAAGVGDAGMKFWDKNKRLFSNPDYRFAGDNRTLTKYDGTDPRTDTSIGTGTARRQSTARGIIVQWFGDTARFGSPSPINVITSGKMLRGTTGMIFEIPRSRFDAVKVIDGLGLEADSIDPTYVRHRVEGYALDTSNDFIGTELEFQKLRGAF